MKALLVVLDGIGDLPHPKLDGKTPLQAARAPHLQKLARNGEVGLQRPARNIAPESDVGVSSVLGHNPFENHVGRGLLEAKGAKMEFKSGDLALRANFATCKNDGVTLIDRRVGRGLDGTDAKDLAEQINKHVHLDGAIFEFKATKGHRGVLVIKAETSLDSHITNTDPAYEVVNGLGSAKEKFEMKIEKAKAWKKGGEKAAKLVNEFTKKSFDALEQSKVNARRKKEGNLPANCVLLRDPESRDAKLAPLPGKWAILSEMPMEEGIAELMDMAVVRLEHFKTPKENFAHTVKKTLETLKKVDGVYVHLKSPDVFGHDGDVLGKTRALEEIDELYFGPLLKNLDLTKTRVLVTGDHATPCIKGSHSNDPVPWLLSGSGIRKKGYPMDETAPGPIINAWELMGKLLER